ncbi:DUF4236 domain-containing protein [Legionella sp. PC997]|uniref:DUF4236 domain-containing protein n=1 Tax=Legionella sp. PC997 TaxID=2755562 RepID=UPI0015F8C2FB|nr:DUF4236 domain-containing protein [Legionella sp. PC997]QMT61831.1 hypothetical protein HBNCFIEN_03238 [Legionella sp. PC997]
MALRFQKRVTLIPGVRLNFGKRGVSLSMGPRGSSMNVGSKGVYGNLGIPGTGLSIRERLDNGASKSNSHPQQELNSSESAYLDVKLKVNDNGILSFATEDGLPLPPKMINQIKNDHSEFLEELLQKAANEINKDFDELMIIHHVTPSPYQTKLTYHELSVPHPKKPKLQKIKFYHRWFGWASDIENKNNNKMSLYQQAVGYWESIKKDHDEATEEFNSIVRQSENGDLDAMEQIFTYALSNLTWAKDTQLSFDFKDQNTLFLDIDLPDLKDMPKRTAEIASRGYKLLIKDRNEIQLKKDFSHLVHAIFFRITGEVFSTLPILQKIVLSGYVQRNNPATGLIENVYIISVEVDKPKWTDIDFSKLEDINPINALERFNLRRNIDRSSNFCSIDPI